MSEWSEHMRSLLGRSVEVVLAYEPERVAVRGKLLSFTDQGEVVLLDEVGSHRWCWPNLDTIALDSKEREPR